MSHVLVVDDEKLIRDMVARALSAKGWRIDTAADGQEALDRIRDERPDVVLLDLMMPKMDGFDVLSAIRADPMLQGLQVIVLTARASQDVLKEALEAGADDYVSKPFHLGEVIARVDAHLRMASYAKQLDRQAKDGETLLQISHRLTGQLDVHGILRDVAGQVATVLGTERCSVVLVGDDGRGGRVVAASDAEEGLTDIPISIDAYPEIRRVLETRRPLLVSDITADPLFDPVKDQVASLAVRSVALFPMLHGERCIGVLFLRSNQTSQAFEERHRQFGQIVANAAAVAVRNADLFREAREESSRADEARALVERLLAIVQRYESFFEDSADGALVVDGDGRVLFMNRQAEALTGITRAQAVDGALEALFAEEEAGAVGNLLERAQRGELTGAVDLRVAANRIASVRVGRIAGHPAFSLTLRDVTEERRLAEELAETKDFLQSLIDASPDAIIAADTSGLTRVFNKAAEALFGYSADEVVGHTHVADLYAPGEAARVMTLIRSGEHGGEGRLTPPARSEVMSREGAAVPVLVGAAVVQLQGENVGSVGVIRDLRERIAIERRLAESEKMALLAELAGTTAHELNQPLQSVMGYAELLARRVPEDDPNRRAVETISREAERMAKIVKQIGQITRYETTTYVGSARIIDLDKAAAEVPAESHEMVAPPHDPEDDPSSA